MQDTAHKTTNSSTPAGPCQTTPTSECPHLRLVSGTRQANCQTCGIYLSKYTTVREHENVAFFAEIPLDEILDQMKAIMHINRAYSPKPNYLRYRRFVVDWMCEIGDTINLSYTTIHHSVALMDTYFSNVSDISTDKKSKEFLQLIALTSIFISAKFREKDSRGPTAYNISTLTRGQYSEKQILNCERNILMCIDYQLHFATPADIVTHFLNQGIMFHNDEVYKGKETRETEAPTQKVVQYVRKFAEFFVDMCLQEYDFQKYDSHTIACSIILASRRAVHFKKTWHDEFSFLLDTQFEQIQECYKTIYKFYMASFPSRQDGSSRHNRSSNGSGKHSNKSTKSNGSDKAKNSLRNPHTTRTALTGVGCRSNSVSHINRDEKLRQKGYIKSNNTLVQPSSNACRSKFSSTSRAGYKSTIPKISGSKHSHSKLAKNMSTMIKNDIITPDKHLMTSIEKEANRPSGKYNYNYKSSSSTKRSTTKHYKHDLKNHRAPRPAFYDSNQQKQKLSNSRNGRVNSRIQTKLDFGSQNGKFVEA